MEKATIVRAVVGGAATLVAIPLLVGIGLEAAKAAGAVTWASSMLTALNAFLSPWYSYALVAVGALALGVFLDWSARRIDGRDIEKCITLANEMASFQDRFLKVYWGLKQKPDDKHDLTLLYTDFQGLQFTLKKAGVSPPWINWELDQDPEHYMKTSMGFIVFFEPMIRRGHMTEARKASRLAMKGKGGYGKYPVLRIDGTLTRIA